MGLPPDSCGCLSSDMQSYSPHGSDHNDAKVFLSSILLVALRLGRLERVKHRREQNLTGTNKGQVI